MMLRIGLKNLKGVFASVLLNIATGDLLSFASAELDKNYSLTTQVERSVSQVVT